MATAKDTGTIERIEWILDNKCGSCGAGLKEFVSRGNKSRVVVERVRLYFYRAATQDYICDDCSFSQLVDKGERE